MKTQKMFNRLALAMVAVGILNGCGAQTALDATNSMPGKIDATNNQVTATNNKMDTMVDQVKQTNSGMTTMVDQVKQTNAGMTTMVSQVEKTNDGITKTNASVHNQTLAVALSTMLSDDNTKNLITLTDMLPAGQVFADEATADEIVQFVYTVMKGLETFPPDASQATDGKFSDAYIKSFNHDKMAKYFAAQIIVGLMTDAKVTDMVNNNILTGGRYEATAYQALALRFDFIDNVLLTNDLMLQPLSNPGLIAMAVKDATSLSLIASFPFLGSIALKTSATDMLPANDGTDNSIQPINASATRPVFEWKLIVKAFDKGLDPKYKVPGNPSEKQLADLKAQALAHIPPDPTQSNPATTTAAN